MTCGAGQKVNMHQPKKWGSDGTAKSIAAVLLALSCIGGVVHAQMFAAGLVDEAWLYVAPLLCGAGRPLIAAEAFGAGSCRMVTRDAVVTGGDVRIRLVRPALRRG